MRPAVAKVRHVSGDRPPEVERLCQVCLEEGRIGALRGHEASTFDRFLAEMFGAWQEEDAETEQRPTAPQPPPQQTPQRIDVTAHFSEATRTLLQRAAQLAVDTGSLDLDTHHLAIAALDDATVNSLLSSIGVERRPVREQLEQSLDRTEPTGIAPSLAPETKSVLLAAFRVSRGLGVDYIGPEHVMLALASDPESSAGRALGRAGLPVEEFAEATRRGGPPEGGGEQGGSATPTLDEFGRDLTQLAREGVLDPVIGRDDEVAQTLEVLARRTKNNPVLIGDPGVGKTAIVEGIAQRIVADEVPDTLEGTRLVSLDLAGMIAGARYRGDFEQRLRSLLEEVGSSRGKLMLFIDELHTIVGAGAAEGAMDAANMLKPALARGELHVVGATTLDEYRQRIEKDAALERRFQPIVVEESTVEDTVQILYGLKDRYEAFHRVRITDEAIEAAAELSDRYVADRFLPDKAIDLIDQASARVKLRERPRRRDRRQIEQELRALQREKQQAITAEDFERAGEVKQACLDVEEQLREHRDGDDRRASEVTAEDIAEVVSRSTGIPVSQLTLEERERLLDLEGRLHQRIVGQEEAVAAVAESVRRSRSGVSAPGRPIGSFMFLGPTGVGKTELARTLAATLFGDEDHMVRFDMSEFQERHTVSRLVGAPPGYVGYEEAGQLTEQVRRRPYSVVLLDEIEKAHPDVFNVLLQLLDDGRLTDGQGRVVNFENTVVIMTSNLGADRISGGGPRQPIGFTTDGRADGRRDYAALRDELWRVLREHFRPEFLNRVDEVVIFRELDRDQLRQITGKLVEGLTARMRGQGIELEFSDDALSHLAEVGFDPDFGARPLQRAIQRRVESPLSRMVIDGAVGSGERLTVDAEDGHLRFEVAAAGEGVGDDEPTWEEPPTRDQPSPAGPSAPRP